MITLFEQKTKVQSKSDLILKDFFKRKDYFADLINAMLFHGKGDFHGNECVLYDSNGTTHVVLDDIVIGLGRERDILMMVYIDGISLIIGLENQSTVDYTMPFRVFVYDMMTYYRQY